MVDSSNETETNIEFVRKSEQQPNDGHNERGIARARPFGIRNDPNEGASRIMAFFDPQVCLERQIHLAIVRNVTSRSERKIRRSDPRRCRNILGSLERLSCRTPKKNSQEWKLRELHPACQYFQPDSREHNEHICPFGSFTGIQSTQQLPRSPLR